jgi:hypothetical protein
MNMHTLHKLTLLFFIVFVFVSKGYSQDSDPGIAILIDPASVTQGSTGIAKATIGNYGNGTIVSNSLTQLENSVPINQLKSIISIYFSGPKGV